LFYRTIVSSRRGPVEMIEGTAKAEGLPYDGKFLRVADVVFNAVLQINP